MNQTDFNTSMVWMGQFAPDRSMIIEDNAAFYQLPTAQIGMSVMDDVAPPSSMQDVNQIMGYIGEYPNGSAVCLPTHHHHSSMPMTTTTSADMYNMPGNPSGTIQTQYLLASPQYILSQDMQGDMNVCVDVDSQQYILQVSDDEDYSQIEQQVHQMDEDDDEEEEDDDDVGDDNNMLQEEKEEEMYEQDAEDNSNQQHSSSIDGDQQQYMRTSMMDDTVEAAGELYYEHEQLSCNSDAENSNCQMIYPMRRLMPPTSKKIKPIERPGLVLKTPIAYQPCQDPSVIPIQRDGMAVCQRCGAIGVKHSFYTKERRYCSMSCARNTFAKVTISSPSRSRHNNSGSDGDCDNDVSNDMMQPMDPQMLGYQFKLAPSDIKSEDGELFKDLLPQMELPQLERPDSPSSQEKIVSVRRKDKKKFYHSFNWDTMMDQKNFKASPVTCFKHTPGYDMWRNICVGLKVEVENTDVDTVSTTTLGPHSFWVAAIIKINGYKAKIRYEGFDDNTRDFWINLCSSEVHQVGWCARRGKPLIPPRSIEDKFSDWKQFLVQRLSGARTLPSNFYTRIDESLKSRFKPGLQLEVVDKLCISQVRVATINNIVGKRLYVRYYDCTPEDNGFWCHEDSQLIHPVGWAKMVGHNLSASAEYLQRMDAASKTRPLVQMKADATPNLFKLPYKLEDYPKGKRTNGFKVGMKLEAIDPLNLSAICVASVMAVLKYGYIMIRIDSYALDAAGSDCFCYHEKSTCIFPVGFCEENNIQLTPPHGYDINTFCWEEHLRKTDSKAAPAELFKRDIPRHGFEVGMRLECCDLMDPLLVCVATVGDVVGRLLRIHFDGWSDEFDQWLDCESPDIFPCGWCVLVGHALQQPSDGNPKRVKKKSVIKRKKKLKLKKDGTPKMTGRPPLINKRSASLRPVVTKHEEDEDEDDEDDEEHDDYESEGDLYSQSSRRSSRSTPLTITPEPHTHPVERKTPSTSIVLQSTSSNSPTPAPPQERKATSYINQTPAISVKYIPRLIDLTNNTNDASSNAELCPESWNIYDVAQFLRVNEATGYCETFSQNKIDGKRLLTLTKDEIVDLLGRRVGPALKIFDLIQQLKCKSNPVHSRLLKAGNSKFL